MAAEIRRAGLEDLELLMAWRMRVLREVFSLHDGQPAGALEAENRRYYQEAVPAGLHIPCFAHMGGEIVGCGGLCLSREMPSPDNPTGKCAYLMNIYTKPQFRKRGVGEAIIKWLVAQATKCGISKIYLETSEAGKRLYTKFGFIPMLDMMKLPEI